MTKWILRGVFDGIQFGIDRAATVALMPYLPGLAKYQLRCCFTGAINTLARLRKIGQIEDDCCPGCQSCPETWTHIADACPAYDAIRYRDFAPTEWHEMPASLRLRGLVQASLADSWHKDDIRGLAANVQYTLLDFLAHRATLLPSHLHPQPRWS